MWLFLNHEPDNDQPRAHVRCPIPRQAQKHRTQTKRHSGWRRSGLGFIHHPGKSVRAQTAEYLERVHIPGCGIRISAADLCHFRLIHGHLPHDEIPTRAALAIQARNETGNDDRTRHYTLSHLLVPILPFQHGPALRMPM